MQQRLLHFTTFFTFYVSSALCNFANANDKCHLSELKIFTIKTEDNIKKSWEVWIDSHNANNGSKPNLFVIGSLIVNSRFIEPVLIKRVAGTVSPQELILEVDAGILVEEGYSVDVFFSEELEDINQYSSVTIYAGDKILIRFDEIEVL
jgi:hypothetical protein